MIAFGCSISESEPYRRYAEPGIRLAREPDSSVFAFAAVDTIARSYNLLLDEAGRQPGLEALVLVHPFAEIVDDRFCAKVREALAQPQVAVAGAAGATGVKSIAWWEGKVSCSAGFRYAYQDHGGGALEGIPWTVNHPAPAEVDAVDGFLLVLSPWVVQNLRFDEALTLGHGYEVDLCFQARAAGRRISTANFAVTERRGLDVVSDLELWTAAHVDFARKWDGRMPGRSPDGHFRTRARRIEAERESTRSMVYFNRLVHEARVEQAETEFEAIASTRSWQLTEPLRRVNQRRREALAARKQAGENSEASPSSGWRSWGRER